MQTVAPKQASMQTTPALTPQKPAQLPSPPPQDLIPNPQPPTKNSAPPKAGNSVTFAALFKENRNLAKCVPLDQEVVCEEGETVVALEEELLSIEEAFGHSLLGCVIGGSVFPRLIQTLIKSWEVDCTYSTHANGWIIFKFGTEVEKDKVLRNGPYSVLGRQWLIKDVPKLFSFKDPCFSSVPIWINLRYLPKQCWSKALLSRIARKIGKPIAMDVVTGDKTKHDGARILVEVDLAKPIVEKVSILMPDGRTWDQGVDYEIKPVLCKNCKGLGHDDCKGPELANVVHPRRRSRSRVRWNVQKEQPKDVARVQRPNSPTKPRGEGEGGSDPLPCSSILSALPKDKGKGIVDEGEVLIRSTQVEGTPGAPKDWQMASPSPSKGMLSPTSVSGAKDIDDVLAEILPMSPNRFAPLFDEDERAPLTNKVKEVVPSDMVGLEGNLAQNPRVRVGTGVKGEDLRRSGRRRRAISSS